MVTTFPGTTIEISRMEKGSSKHLFDGIFATGGITLSQVCVMTGLEPYIIQNWVKRGFLSSPKNRVYSREQFALIAIINMLRESLPIETICNLIRFIVNTPDDRSDDLISYDHLYHLYVDMTVDLKEDTEYPRSLQEAALQATREYKEPIPGARSTLIKILKIMNFSHRASLLRKEAEYLLSTLQ